MTNNRPKNAFKIQPADNVIMRIAYSKPQPNAKHYVNHIKKRKNPQYFINLDIQNHHKPKERQQPKHLARRNGNPYKHFPLKGENI